ncbi:hypothetical protein [Lacipirellula limnantheis]|uniref:Uncharacterized protein n=1 Tax=Lacipirellula limnantheis TaxID=2528024 RepID=A0A517U0Z0_9BACT|nr:hypothetical protein [Lacipirellula limnantheis]QDT74273.1 hypothetical protein I41_34680 [Lacipirellula limnantheis]
MGILIRILFPLIGYACVATVISGALAYGYLVKSGKLDDEKLFRITAILQDVDLEEIEHEAQVEEPGTPPEEPSFDQQRRQYQTISLQFDVKEKQLADSLVDFDYQLKRLSGATEQYARLRAEVEEYLVEQGKLVLSEEMQKVRKQLESLIPKKQAKPILIKYITDDRIDDVIMLLGSMKPRDQEAILRTFDAPEDLEMLYRIQRKMLAGEPAKPFIDAQLQTLEQMKAQQN